MRPAPRSTGRGLPLPSTQQRVLDISAALFNVDGVEMVSIGQIAETLEISPGNLTYHYRRKADLIQHHFRLLECSALIALENFPVRAQAGTFAAALFDFMAEVYRYRFLFLGARYLTRSKLISPRCYRILIERARRATIQQIEQLVRQGHMPPLIDPISPALLVDSIWWQWLGRMLAMQITPPLQASTPSTIVAESIIDIVLSNPHYAALPFFRAVREETQKRACALASE